MLSPFRVGGAGSFGEGKPAGRDCQPVYFYRLSSRRLMLTDSARAPTSTRAASASRAGCPTRMPSCNRLPGDLGELHLTQGRDLLACHSVGLRRIGRLSPLRQGNL